MLTQWKARAVLSTLLEFGLVRKAMNLFLQQTPDRMGQWTSTTVKNWKVVTKNYYHKSQPALVAMQKVMKLEFQITWPISSATGKI